MIQVINKTKDYYYYYYYSYFFHMKWAESKHKFNPVEHGLLRQLSTIICVLNCVQILEVHPSIVKYGTLQCYIHTYTYTYIHTSVHGFHTNGKLFHHLNCSCQVTQYL